MSLHDNILNESKYIQELVNACASKKEANKRIDKQNYYKIYKYIKNEI